MSQVERGPCLRRDERRDLGNGADRQTHREFVGIGQHVLKAFEPRKDMASVNDLQVIRQHVIGARPTRTFALARAENDGGEDLEPVEPWKLAPVLPHLLILTLGIGEASGLRLCPRLWRLAHAAHLNDPGGQEQDETAEVIFKAEHMAHCPFDQPALHMGAELMFLSELLGDDFLSVLTSCSSSFAGRAGCACVVTCGVR